MTVLAHVILHSSQKGLSIAPLCSQGAEAWKVKPLAQGCTATNDRARPQSLILEPLGILAGPPFYKPVSSTECKEQRGVTTGN